MTDTEILEYEGKIRSLIEQQKFPEALKVANEWIEDEPGNDKAYYLRGYANITWGQMEEAIADVKKAISIEPGTAKYYNTLGAIYSDIGNQEAALGEYERALHIEPDNLEYKSSLCKAQMHLGQVDDAMQQVEGMFRTNQDNDAIRENLAEIYSVAAIKNWHYVPEEDSHYATTHEDILYAEQFVGKARALAVSDTGVLERLDELETSIKISKKRKFTGGWGALIVALIFAMVMFPNGTVVTYAYAFSAILFYYALRTPQYVINHMIFTGKDNLSLGDRIASIFVCDDWIFFGPTYGAAAAEKAKTELFFAAIRTAVKLALLPVTVTTALFNNYHKNHAFSIVGVVAGVIFLLVLF